MKSFVITDSTHISVSYLEGGLAAQTPSEQHLIYFLNLQLVFESTSKNSIFQDTPLPYLQTEIMDFSMLNFPYAASMRWILFCCCQANQLWKLSALHYNAWGFSPLWSQFALMKIQHRHNVRSCIFHEIPVSRTELIPRPRAEHLIFCCKNQMHRCHMTTLQTLVYKM